MTEHKQNTDLTDQALLDAMQSGDESAFTTLYTRYWRKLFVVATHKLQDPSIAEEITQDLFADLWNRRNRLDIKGHLSGYLAVALKYKIIDLMAHEQHRRRYVLHQKTQANEMDDSTRQWLDYEELRTRLEQLVDDLPERCRIVYSLKQDGHTQKQIAEQLGISPNTVENHLSKAYKLLREQLHWIRKWCKTPNFSFFFKAQ